MPTKAPPKAPGKKPPNPNNLRQRLDENYLTFTSRVSNAKFALADWERADREYKAYAKRSEAARKGAATRKAKAKAASTKKTAFVQSFGDPVLYGDGPLPVYTPKTFDKYDPPAEDAWVKGTDDSGGLFIGQYRSVTVTGSLKIRGYRIVDGKPLFTSNPAFYYIRNSITAAKDPRYTGDNPPALDEWVEGKAPSGTLYVGKFTRVAESGSLRLRGYRIDSKNEVRGLDNSPTTVYVKAAIPAKDPFATTGYSITQVPDIGAWVKGRGIEPTETYYIGRYQSNNGRSTYYIDGYKLNADGTIVGSPLTDSPVTTNWAVVADTVVDAEDPAAAPDPPTPIYSKDNLPPVGAWVRGKDRNGKSYIGTFESYGPISESLYLNGYLLDPDGNVISGDPYSVTVTINSAVPAKAPADRGTKPIEPTTPTLVKPDNPSFSYQYTPLTDRPVIREIPITEVLVGDTVRGTRANGEPGEGVVFDIRSDGCLRLANSKGNESGNVITADPVYLIEGVASTNLAVRPNPDNIDSPTLRNGDRVRTTDGEMGTVDITVRNDERPFGRAGSSYVPVRLDNGTANGFNNDRLELIAEGPASKNVEVTPGNTVTLSAGDTFTIGSTITIDSSGEVIGTNAAAPKVYPDEIDLFPPSVRKVIKNELERLDDMAQVMEGKADAFEHGEVGALLATLASDPIARRNVGEAIDRASADLSVPDKYDGDVVIGAGVHAAIYAAVHYRKTGRKVMVLERRDRLGGVFDMSKTPAFWLNSRNRTGGAGTPGDEDGALNYLPGAMIQLSEIPGGEYHTNVDMAWLIKVNLAMFADVYTGVNVTMAAPTTDASVAGDGVLINYGKNGKLYAKHAIFATGLGDPAKFSITSDRYMTFPKFMSKMDMPVGMAPNLGRVAVIGAGDSGKTAVEALIGQGPHASIAALEVPTRIDWWDQEIPLDCANWQLDNRTRYKSIGPAIGRKIKPIRDRVETVTSGYNGIYVNGTLYDNVIDCRGFTNDVIAQQKRSLDYTKFLEGGRTVSLSDNSRKVWFVGPATEIGVQVDEPYVAQQPENIAAIFRYADRTAAVANMLATKTNMLFEPIQVGDIVYGDRRFTGLPITTRSYRQGMVTNIAPEGIILENGYTLDPATTRKVIPYGTSVKLDGLKPTNNISIGGSAGEYYIVPLDGTGSRYVDPADVLVRDADGEYRKLPTAEALAELPF
jgi:hypothetical protein